MQTYENERQLHGFEDIRRFVSGGKALFTIRSIATGKRHTYKLKRQLDQNEMPTGSFYVSILFGPDNYSNYLYLGMADENLNFRTTAGTKLKKDGKEVAAIAYFLRFLKKETFDAMMEHIEFFHAGKCCQCGRRLTVPESIESGIGPVCAGIQAAA